MIDASFRVRAARTAIAGVIAVCLASGVAVAAGKTPPAPPAATSKTVTPAPSAHPKFVKPSPLPAHKVKSLQRQPAH